MCLQWWGNQDGVAVGVHPAIANVCVPRVLQSSQMCWLQNLLSTNTNELSAASYGRVRYGYYHTLLTSAVSHYSMGHIFSNMFTFYFFGSNLCQVIGSVRVRHFSAEDGLVFSCTCADSLCVDMQLLQLYATAAIIGAGTQVFADQRAVCLGASAAVNAMVIFSVLLNPTATYLIYGIVPAPAWALGTAWIAYDTFGAYKVQSLLALTEFASHPPQSTHALQMYLPDSLNIKATFQTHICKQFLDM